MPPQVADSQGIQHKRHAGWCSSRLKWVGLLALAGCCVLTAFVWRTWDRTGTLHSPTSTPLLTRRSSRAASTLVFGPAHCVECHSASSEAFERFAETGELPPLVGGQRFAAAPLGAILLAEHHAGSGNRIGRYSDAQIARMLRYAVRADGRASVRPLMQYATT